MSSQRLLMLVLSFTRQDGEGGVTFWARQEPGRPGLAQDAAGQALFTSGIRILTDAPP